MEQLGARQIAIAAALTVLAAIGTTLALSFVGPDWSVFAPASCVATRCFCEMPRIASLILQPADSWSSYGYVFGGFLMILLAKRRDSAMTPLAMIAFGATAIAVGIGSALLHATLTLWGQFLDVLGMYLVGSFLLVSALSRWRRIGDRPAIGLYGLLCAVLVAVLIVEPEVRRWLFAVLLIAAIVLELGFARALRTGVRLPLYLYGLLANAVAFGIWNLDQHGLVCSPASLIQGHAVWHLLGALSMWLCFGYYRSERAGSITAK
jgi:dihydroceramidase